MAQVDSQTLGVDELHARLSDPEQAVAIHRDARKAETSFSEYLNRLQPSEKGDTLDAFERQLKRAGIITRSDPAAGQYACLGEKFFEAGKAGRALYAEFFTRQYRKVAYAPRQQQRAIVLSSDSIIGSWDRPYADAAITRWEDRVTAAIPLSELIAITTPIDGADYRSSYMVYDAAAVRKYRVGESAEIPMGKLTPTEHIIRLQKYGRGIELSYEAMRRLRVDRLAWWIQFSALQDEIDKVSAAITILIDGDGNSNAATNHNVNTLDTGAAGALTLRAWLNFGMQFDQPYMLTHALMRKAAALDLRLLNSGSGNVPLAGYSFGGPGMMLTPINVTADAVRYGWTNDVAADVLLGYDRRFGLEMVTEIGSEITETERFITSQRQVMVMSEVLGFSILDGSAARTLTLNA
jgi:hypothetical protein